MEMGKDLNETLEKIVLAGGKVLMPKTLISAEKGYWALYFDTKETNWRCIRQSDHDK